MDYTALLKSLLAASPTIRRIELTAALKLLPAVSSDPLITYAHAYPTKAINAVMGVLAIVKADPELQAALLARFSPQATP